MKIIQQYTPPTVNLGHASSVMNSNNSNAYLVFPEATIPGEETQIGNRSWYALFAESPPEIEHRGMAAQLTVESMYRYLVENKSEKTSPRYILESAMCHANSTLRCLAQQEQLGAHFHTSALGACISHNRFYFTYVGNIHAYLLRSKVIYRLTHTPSNNYHTFPIRHQRSIINYQRPAHEIEPTIDSTTHFLGSESIPMVKHISFNVKNTLSRSINSFSPKVMDYLLLRLDDLIVLCSSSVSASLEPSQIKEIATALPTQLASEEMLKIARQRQPEQNHTAVVLRQNPACHMDNYLSHRHRTDLSIA